MLKKLIFAGLLYSFTTIVSAQYSSSALDSIETPPELQRIYDLLLSKKDAELVNNEYNNYSTEGVFFDDSIYIKRLHSLPTKMELVYNPAVKSEIEKYAGRRRQQVSFMLGEGFYYFPIFEEALDKEGLPLELKYLPVIESALNPVARSRVGASGLWQFMASTGKMYNLEVNSLVDERFDPHKSTEAAVAYLKDLYDKYGDWNLVIAAYNCGPGRVDKAISRSGGKTDYWDIYPHLPRETRGYVPIFIAATYIMNYFNEHNITPDHGSRPQSMDSLVVEKTIHLKQIADVLNIPIEQIRKYNPQFKTDVIPGDYKGYTLNLPINNLTAFIEKQDEIYAYNRDILFSHRKIAGANIVEGPPLGSVTVTHRVKRGDTLAGLASLYNVTSAEIKQWNGLSSNKLSSGRQLKIYKTKYTDNESLLADEGASSDTTLVSVSGLIKTVSVPKTVISYYQVKKGDIWSGVAKKNNATIADIKKWNNIKNNTLIAGKTLKIEKVEYIQIQETIKLSEPRLPVVLVDMAYCASLIDNYLGKMDRDESTLPLIRIATTDSDDSGDSERRSSSIANKIIYHKVKIGETITQIAARYNVSMKDIVTWNKLPSSMAKVGQRLLILLPETSNTTENETQTKENRKSYAINK